MDKPIIAITIEVEASQVHREFEVVGYTWEAIVRVPGGPILWRSMHKENAADAFRVAARLISDMHADFLYAAERGATVYPPKTPKFAYAF